MNQISDYENIRMLKGVISKGHVHIHIKYRPFQNISDIIKRLKGRTSRRLQAEYPKLSKHYWGIGYGVWSTGNIRYKMVKDYLEHHRNPSNEDGEETIILK